MEICGSHSNLLNHFVEVRPLGDNKIGYLEKTPFNCSNYFL